MAAVRIRRSKARKGSAQRNDAPFKSAAAEYRKALDNVDTYERECAEVLARLAELRDARDVACSKLEVEAKSLLRGSRPARASGLKVYKQAKSGNRKVDARILMAKYPNIWTHDGVVSVKVSSYDKLVASGVVEDAKEYVTRGAATEAIHIEIEEQNDGN